MRREISAIAYAHAKILKAAHAYAHYIRLSIRGIGVVNCDKLKCHPENRHYIRGKSAIARPLALIIKPKSISSYTCRRRLRRHRISPSCILFPANSGRSRGRFIAGIAYAPIGDQICKMQTSSHGKEPPIGGNHRPSNQRLPSESEMPNAASGRGDAHRQHTSCLQSALRSLVIRMRVNVWPTVK